MPDVYQLILLVSCIACAMSATSILVRDPDEAMNRYAAAIVFGGAFWAFCEVLWNRAEDAETALFYVKLSALGWIFIGPLGMQLLLEMAGRPKEPIRQLLRVLYVAAFALLAVDWFTPLIHERVVRTEWGWSYELGPTYLLFYVITTASLVGGISVVGFELPKWTSRGERAQGLGLICGIMVPLTVASLTDGLLPLFDIHVWHLGTASIAMLGGIVTWTFHRYGYSLLAPGTFAREILETLPEGVMLLHLDGRVRRANPAMLEFVGVASHAELQFMPAQPLFDGQLVLNDEILHEAEMRIVPIDGGAPTPVAVSTRMLRNRLDEPTGLVVVARDLREIVNLRQRVTIGGRMAAVGQLAAGVAHELNNPIAYVRANLSMLLEHWGVLRSRHDAAVAQNEMRGDAAKTETDRWSVDATKTVGGGSGVEPEKPEDDASLWDEGIELIHESLEGVERATSIVRDIKTFSHGAGHEREIADVTRLLDATLRIASPQLRHRVRVEREDGDLPVIECAPREIQQVFLNLLLNAVDACPLDESGELPRIAIETSADGRHVRVCFSDEGEGIEESSIERIFDPFFTTKPAGEGTGLGLALSYEIVRRHGGDISVQSEVGVGTSFTVVLPRPDES